MSATAYGWLVLAFPLAGTLINGIGFRWLPGRTPGWIGGLSGTISIGQRPRVVRPWLRLSGTLDERDRG